MSPPCGVISGHAILIFEKIKNENFVGETPQQGNLEFFKKLA